MSKILVSIIIVLLFIGAFIWVEKYRRNSSQHEPKQSKIDYHNTTGPSAPPPNSSTFIEIKTDLNQ
jgi:hypothetical protein